MRCYPSTRESLRSLRDLRPALLVYGRHEWIEGTCFEPRKRNQQCKLDGKTSLKDGADKVVVVVVVVSPQKRAKHECFSLLMFCPPLPPFSYPVSQVVTPQSFIALALNKQHVAARANARRL